MYGGQTRRGSVTCLEWASRVATSVICGVCAVAIRRHNGTLPGLSITRPPPAPLSPPPLSPPPPPPRYSPCLAMVVACPLLILAKTAADVQSTASNHLRYWCTFVLSRRAVLFTLTIACSVSAVAACYLATTITNGQWRVAVSRACLPFSLISQERSLE